LSANDQPTVIKISELHASLDHYYEQLYRIQVELTTAAIRRAQYRYVGGAALGLLAFGLLSAIAAAVAWLIGHSVHEKQVALAFACATAGALGAAARASWRAAFGDLLVDPAAGIAALPRLGAIRPTVGAIFGLAVYFALESGFIRIGEVNRNVYFFTFFSFVAGFSERLVPDLIRRAEERLAGRPTSDPISPPGTPQGTQRRSS
jgi:hypothetical protein